MVELKRLVVAIIGSFFAAILWLISIIILIPQQEIGQDISTLIITSIFSVLFVIFSYLSYTRTSRAAHSAGWSFALLSVGSLMLPFIAGISTFLFSTSTQSEAGVALLAGGIVTFILMFFGLFFGIAFAIIAYFLLKAKSKDDKNK